MKQAIVTGATGFIGSHLAKFLAYYDVEVYAIGRKKITEVNPSILSESKNLHYIKLDMKDISFLENELKFYDLSDCVFYNFAWGGNSGLSDLNVSAQMDNAIWTVKAYETASKLKCTKFVHVGTMEEAFADEYFSKDFHVDEAYNRHLIYSIAKRTSRNLLKSVYSYDAPSLIIASNSHIMGPNDRRDSFLTSVIKKIIKQEPLNLTSCVQNFDVVSVFDCVRAFKLIGENGKNGSEYWVGSGKPQQLKNYVLRMVNMFAPNLEINFGMMPYNDVILSLDTFSPHKLKDDTGFECKQTYEEAVQDLYDYYADGKSSIHYDL